jgi:hypothetical protein
MKQKWDEGFVQSLVVIANKNEKILDCVLSRVDKLALLLRARGLKINFKLHAGSATAGA